MATEDMLFYKMSEAELRQWVEANPGSVNDRDRTGWAPLNRAADEIGLSMVVWLLDEKGADVNVTTTSFGASALHQAISLDILKALLDRYADPTIKDSSHGLPVMWHAFHSSADMVARLRQDPRVRATINVQDANGNTALHCAGSCSQAEEAALKIHALLHAGADPTITRNNGETPLDVVRRIHSTYQFLIALLEQYPDAKKDAEKAYSSSRPAASPSPPTATQCVFPASKIGWHKGSPCRVWRRCR